MQPGARLAAAIEVLADIIERHRTAAIALADWGKAHRFAGSGDRAAIGNIVYDALRKRASLSALMGADTPRALVLGVMAHVWGEPADKVVSLCDGSAHAPPPLSEDEIAGLRATLAPDTPAHILGDYPEWLDDQFQQAFGMQAADQGAGLAMRAPMDLRANLIKADRAKLAKALARYHPQPTPYSPLGLRVVPPSGSGRSPNLLAEPAQARGWFEVQDEASQIAGLLAGVKPGMQVADICAGAGGKTLLLAAQMGNKGQIYAHDSDAQRLRPIFDRLKSSGARNVQVLPPGDEAALSGLAGRMDVVFVDAPCSGSGAWRRRPDTKWRLTPDLLRARMLIQAEVLRKGALLVRPGGRLVYATCSVLPQENGQPVVDFLGETPEFSLTPYRQMWSAALSGEPPASADGLEETLLLSPANHSTDGFFVAVMARSGG
jgi:16S rRNA (cytosine967-C5)-methyltransferase